jgi:hypothetical protein
LYNEGRTPDIKGIKDMQAAFNSERSKVDLHVSKPLSIFICPCHCIEADRIKALKELAKEPIAQLNRDELIDVELSNLEFVEECVGLRAHFSPRVLFLPGLEWIALALETELSPIGDGPILFKQLLAFNSNWRVCQGRLERPDSPVLDDKEVQFSLSSGRRVEEVFRDVAIEILGCFEPPVALTRAVALSMANFESPLGDSDLYSFGTIAHSDETVDPEWAAKVLQKQVHDRWREAGIRLFIHSYSLVASCSPPRQALNQDLLWFRPMFRGFYTRLGARVAMERAGLLQMAATIHDIRNVGELREHRSYWANFRRTLGVRWTPEKTQRVQVEQMWRDISGLRQMSEEIDQRLDQTVGVFEAEATGRLNRLMSILTVIVGSFAAAEVTVELTRDLGLIRSLPWAIGMSVAVGVALFLWLRWRWGKDKL